MNSIRRGMSSNTNHTEYSDDEREFMVAMDTYKCQNRRPFPAWTEVLAVLLSLGYRKVEPAVKVPDYQPQRD
ncbi:MAG: hypothetical protein KGL39_47110 [Patescibacteria group bacterium]|nr:hypothetical protein [Patescibacteria group bacterium]